MSMAIDKNIAWAELGPDQPQLVFHSLNLFHWIALHTSQDTTLEYFGALWNCKKFTLTPLLERTVGKMILPRKLWSRYSFVHRELKIGLSKKISNKKRGIRHLNISIPVFKIFEKGLENFSSFRNISNWLIREKKHVRMFSIRERASII